MNAEAAQLCNPSTADKTAIHTLHEQLVESWNRGDGETYGSTFTEDADYVDFNGQHLKGRRAIASHHQQLFDTFLQGTHLEYRLTQIRFLRPEIAVLHAEGGIVMPWQSTVSRWRRSIHTLIAVKDDSEWRFAIFHNTRIRPIGPGTIVSGLANSMWQRIRRNP